MWVWTSTKPNLLVACSSVHAGCVALVCGMACDLTHLSLTSHFQRFWPIVVSVSRDCLLWRRYIDGILFSCLMKACIPLSFGSLLSKRLSALGALNCNISSHNFFLILVFISFAWLVFCVCVPLPFARCISARLLPVVPDAGMYFLVLVLAQAVCGGLPQCSCASLPNHAIPSLEAVLKIVR